MSLARLSTEQPVKRLQTQRTPFPPANCLAGKSEQAPAPGGFRKTFSGETGTSTHQLAVGAAYESGLKGTFWDAFSNALEPQPPTQSRKC